MGAYRCPNCGIDFPSGTPFAPKAAHSPSETDPRRREPKARAASHDAAQPEDAEFELGDHPDDTLDIAPLREGSRGDQTFSGKGEDIRPDARAGGSARSGTGAANLDVRPRGGDDGESTSAALSVRPARATNHATDAVGMVVHEGEPRELMAPRRRSIARGLTGTVFSALLLIGVVGAGTWWLDEQGSLVQTPPSAAETDILVEVQDGWVTLPVAETPFEVSADGPFRLRVEGKVYTMAGETTIRVPAAAAAAVRVIREPTKATARALP